MAHKQPRDQFLRSLQSEARAQAQLSEDHLFPSFLDQLGGLILNHTLPFILATSALVALATAFFFSS